MIDAIPKGFIVGCGKSGTTWLKNIIAGHPHAVVDGEGALGWRLLPELVGAAKLFNAHQDRFKLGGHTKLTEDDLVQTFRFACLQRFAAYARRAGKDLSSLRLIGDKTPQHTVVMAQLAAVFPEAKFVHVVRDPRDAATSAWFHFGQGGDTNTPAFEKHASEFISGPWSVCVGAAVKAELDSTGRVTHVRYELLHASPEEEVGRVLGFLGLDTGTASIDACLEAGRFERFAKGRGRGEEDAESFYRKGIVGDWANHMTEAQALRTCAPVRTLMERLSTGSVRAWWFSSLSPRGRGPGRGATQSSSSLFLLSRSRLSWFRRPCPYASHLLSPPARSKTRPAVHPWRVVKR